MIAAPGCGSGGELRACVNGCGTVRVEVYIEEYGATAEVGAGTADAPSRARVGPSWGRSVVIAEAAAAVWLSPRSEDRFSSVAVLGATPLAARPAVGLMGDDE
jgi:hypothetical protein